MDKWDIIDKSVTAALTIVGFVLGHLSGRASEQRKNYVDLDKTYFELLKMRLEDPTNATKESYELMMWNFLESIYDQTDLEGELWETWKPVFETEGRNHYPWFSRQAKAFFKDTFIGVVDERFKQETPPAKQSAA